MAQSLIKELFVYSNGALFWKEDRLSGKHYTVVAARKGDRAGSVDSYGYRQVTIKGRLELEHRVIFLLHHGWLPKELDHIDGDSGNNAIENLRPATRKQNTHNQKKRANSCNPYKGVAKANSKWKARIMNQGKRQYLGVFSTPEEAHDAYCKAANLIYGAFANNGNRS